MKELCNIFLFVPLWKREINILLAIFIFFHLIIILFCLVYHTLLRTFDIEGKKKKEKKKVVHNPKHHWVQVINSFHDTFIITQLYGHESSWKVTKDKDKSSFISKETLYTQWPQLQLNGNFGFESFLFEKNKYKDTPRKITFVFKKILTTYIKE